MSIEAKTTEVQTYPADLTAEIQSALAALADVETRYEVEREEIDRSAPQDARDGLLGALEARRRAERGPVVQRLAELQQVMTFAALRRSWAKPSEAESSRFAVEVERSFESGTNPRPQSKARVGTGHL